MKKTFIGIHGTAKRNVNNIIQEGFKIFSPNHYLGRGVYLYATTKKGKKLASVIAKRRAKEMVGDIPIMLWAKFSAFPERIIDLVDYDNSAILEDLNKIVREKMDAASYSEEEYNKKCNDTHIAFVEDLRKELGITDLELLCACLPFGRDIAKGYVLPNPNIIDKYIGIEEINL